MKTLLLVRHAKSDWNDATLSDFDRPLNDRGKKDAPLMAQRLRDKKIVIDAFISSPAKRARKTAIIFANNYMREKEEIIFKPELYEADPKTFFNVISAVDDRYQNIAVFSHNFGLTEFANQLTDTRIDNIPTCGIFALKIDCKKWKDFKTAGKTFWFFDYPKA